MNLIAWNKETDEAISPERMPNNLEWARFPSGVKKQYSTPPPHVEPVVTKFISPTDIVLLFPAASVSQLNDYAWEVSNTDEERGTAQQILYALKGNRDIDVASNKFAAMLVFMSAAIPSFGETEESAFKDALGI